MLKEKGFTLIEIMIAMAISGIIMAAVYTTFTMSSRSVTNQMRIADLQQNLRASMYIIEQNIRKIGYNPHRLKNGQQPGIIAAGISSIRFQADLNENGHSFNPLDAGDNGLYSPSTDLGEDITIGLIEANSTGGDTNADAIADSFPSTLRRITINTDGSDWSLAIANDIEVAEFVYLDMLGAQLADPNGAPLTYPIAVSDLNRIRKIQVTIIARSATERAKYVNTISYLNPQGRVLLPPQNDSFERRMLTKTIDCRNLGLITN